MIKLSRREYYFPYNKLLQSKFGTIQSETIYSNIDLGKISSGLYVTIRTSSMSETVLHTAQFKHRF